MKEKTLDLLMECAKTLAKFIMISQDLNGDVRLDLAKLMEFEKVAFGEVDKDRKPKEQPKKSNEKTVKSEEVDLPF